MDETNMKMCSKQYNNVHACVSACGAQFRSNDTITHSDS